MIKRLTRIALAIMTLTPALTFAGDLKPRAEVNFRTGSERSILMTEFWAPLAQQSDRVLYGDLRLMGDGDDNREGNLGFGYRQLLTKTNFVLGANAWIDRRRTANGNNFHQLTLGVESLGDTIDLRANSYIQLNSSKTRITPNIGSAAPYLAGTGIFFDTNGFIIEEPQDGFDAEVGYRLPLLQKHIDVTRVYAGGYYFWGDATDNVTGFRIRTEAQVNSILSVGARFQHDGPRGSQCFLEATLRFPFKSKKLYQEHGLRSRLDESPERDIDIVTGSKVDNGLMKQALNTNGTSQRILYIDNTNTNTGDGSKENPFNTLTSAQAALQENDIVYINRGDGTTTGMDQGIIINKANIQLIGSGSALTYGGFTLLNAGLAPVLTNTQTRTNEYTGNGVLVTADNATVAGITVSNATGSGIIAMVDGASQNFNSFTVHDISTYNNVRWGVIAYTINGGTINDVSITNSVANNSLRGIEIRASGANSSINNAVIQNNFTNGNTNHGISIEAITGGFINTVSIFENHTSLNSVTGISLGSNNGKIGTAYVRNNTIENNAQNGFYSTAQNYGAIETIEYINNASMNNAHNGALFAQTNGNVNSILIEGNIFAANTRSGVSLLSQSEGTVSSLTMRNNELLNNIQNGIQMAAYSGRFGAALFQNNIIQNNAQNGFIFNTTGTGAFGTVSLASNTVTGNGTASSYYGIMIDNDGTGAFSIDLGSGASNTGQNRIYSNSYQDVYIDSQPGTGSTGGVTISAQYNWWGVNTGLAVGRRTLDGTSGINAGNFLTTDPHP